MNTKYRKYPRTPHLPWSREKSDDDISLAETKSFLGKEIVITEKLDGECTAMYNDHIHARSIDSANHPSRDWVKNFWSTIKWKIPNYMVIYGENVYAKHSIKYYNLHTYFYGFCVMMDNLVLDWDSTLDWLFVAGIQPVPILYRGIYDENIVKSFWDESKQNVMEGYVIRNVNTFRVSDFNKNVAKFVRKNHVQTEIHWMHQQIEPNHLLDS